MIDEKTIDELKAEGSIDDNFNENINTIRDRKEKAIGEERYLQLLEYLYLRTLRVGVSDICRNLGYVQNNLNEMHEKINDIKVTTTKTLANVYEIDRDKVSWKDVKRLERWFKIVSCLFVFLISIIIALAMNMPI